jgi:hypothetical protein
MLRVLYIQGENAKETEGWLNTVQKAVTVVSLLIRFEKTFLYRVWSLVVFLNARWRTSTDVLFRHLLCEFVVVFIDGYCAILLLPQKYSSMLCACLILHSSAVYSCCPCNVNSTTNQLVLCPNNCESITGVPSRLNSGKEFTDRPVSIAEITYGN